jgi:uncharacterized membrane protein
MFPARAMLKRLTTEKGQRHMPFRLPVERARKTWENVESSLWFIPSIFVSFAIALSFLLPELDRRVVDDISEYRRWIFFGTADAARTVLSAIGGSLITVISLLFSVTVIVLQQATTQFSPRVMRTFTSDRGSQIVLGIYVATFLYALLVLRQIRGEDAAIGEFVPLLSVTASLIFALICVGALIYFIHHIATLLQISTIIESVHEELLAAIDQLYPAQIGEPAVEDVDSLSEFRERYGDPATVIAAEQSGFLRSVDESALVDALPAEAWAIVHPHVGDYLIRGTTLVESGGAEIDDDRRQRVLAALVLDRQRSPTQDALFGIRQLVDIGLKALSPSIHDPTTAEQVISVLGDVLAALAGRAFPPRIRRVERDDRTHVLWLDRPGFGDYVDASFDQLRGVATGNIHVTLHLLDTIATVARQAPVDRRSSLLAQVEAISDAFEEGAFSGRDRWLMRERMSAAREVFSS